MAKNRTFTTHIDIAAPARDQLIALINQQLADTFDLLSQVKQAHWNVKGPQFIALHELFDDLAANLLDHVDTIAERAVILGGQALGTARMAAAASRLPEYPAEITDGMQHVANLVARYAKVGATTRQAITTATELNDADTADMFTQVSRDLDKYLWFLEAHIQA
ncbi:DNA starvation/stationary phase protection protein Dps [Oscillochloris sp. ZM17-4]|uniref:DNA starvation/stationary phase protection protein Dps n=1 Tax=Oscillochloris sp. ZM17-4 TaxID=2866714 RepID=UPI001C72DCD3|nr:DNA starvation/stationary phase protection protein Dps [Oscillochloris sp. ZM17-4]MBX0330580.1 DNA starvation/stationary phase protection protein Dps [Oscillochloris sp. ZM17-4]